MLGRFSTCWNSAEQVSRSSGKVKLGMRRRILLATACVSTLTLCVTGCGNGNPNSHNGTSGTASPTPTYPVASAHEMRDRSREIIRELLAMIPQEYRVSNEEEERNDTVKRELSTCNDYFAPPESWDGSYSYMGGLGVELKTPAAAEDSVEIIAAELAKQGEWSQLERSDTDRGPTVSAWSDDGFDVSVRAITNSDKGPMVAISAYSPCFYPAESPWPRNSEL